MTLIVSTIGLKSANVLSTPSPNEIFLTVNEELMSLFFFAIQTPSKYWILSLFPSVILTPTLITSPGKKSGNFFLPRFSLRSLCLFLQYFSFVCLSI